MPDLTRVYEEIRTGRDWKSLDRLSGLLSSYPTSKEVLELTGELHYKMGNLPEAGRFWLLTGRCDESARRAFAAYKERTGTRPSEMLRRLPLLAPLDEYEPSAQTRLRELGRRAEAEGYFIPQKAQRQSEPGRDHDWKKPGPARRETLWYHTERVIMLTILIGPWLAGFFTLVLWFVALAAPSSVTAILRDWLSLGRG